MRRRGPRWLTLLSSFFRIQKYADIGKIHHVSHVASHSAQFTRSKLAPLWVTAGRVSSTCKSRLLAATSSDTCTWQTVAPLAAGHSQPATYSHGLHLDHVPCHPHSATRIGRMRSTTCWPQLWPITDTGGANTTPLALWRRWLLGSTAWW
jgi:hypothetical protein